MGATKLAALLTTSSSVTVPAGGTESVTAECRPESGILSGGFHSDSSSAYAISSGSEGNGWKVTFHNGGGSAAAVTADATCLSY